MNREKVSLLMLTEKWDWEKIRKFLYHLEQIVGANMGDTPQSEAPGWLIFIATDEQITKAYECMPETK